MTEVFIVCNTIHELGGVQRWAHRIGELLAERGHRVHLVGIFAVRQPHELASADPDGERVEPAYQTSLIHPNLYGGKPKPALLSRIANPLAYVRYKRWQAVQRSGAGRLRALFAGASDPADTVVICAQVHAMEWVAQAAPPNLPVIAMSHESYAAANASSRGRRVRSLYRTAARFVSLTDADAHEWTRAGMNNAAAIPNPLPIPALGGADPAARVVVAAGRLSQEKGFDLLLDAWHQAVLSRPGWTLRIYGSGPEHDALREQARSLGLESSVDFAGQTGDIAAALVEGSIFASGSRAEGFPMSLLEAMACALPCVAFDCAPGVRELVHDGVNGLLAPPGNTEALANALGRLMDDAGERATMGKAALESVSAYAPDRIVDRWERMITLVLR
ncbi:MAG TPA: glycosyltransferase family 4 protein [Actinocrinis sp.]|uniref:glycosyltransferase family 4 protein n=1 Tax=Actinocrinis sp. TaxID=1920516 RepID=UPI002D6C5EFB|nr:glycosyltransferase family 4 protein [Actinocrinis sp.]HZU59050.1 glycosyltransferase family 4 protein [Actinocrinis sp.]